MKLSDYLDKNGETQYAFAKRTGLPLSTVSVLYHRPAGSGCRVDTALVVIDATNGKVSLEDLASDAYWDE